MSASWLVSVMHGFYLSGGAGDEELHGTPLADTPPLVEKRNGIALGAAAYLMWGLFPLYWPLLKPIGAFEILAHRVLWSLLVVVALLIAMRKLAWFRTVPREKLAWLTLASALIAINWVLYIWAVNSGHVVETSLGYFINPLVSVLLGVLVLKEKLRRAQWLVLGGALVGVLVLAFDAGRPPWIALGLAPTFGLYGLVKKRTGVGSVESLSFETTALVPFALGYLVWLELSGAGSFGHVAALQEALLVGAGVMTAVPLICFGAAANRIPLSMLGLLQYFAPSLQFMCGVFVFHEEMTAGRWLGFAFIWSSLAVFVAEGLLHARRRASGLTPATP
jgi:chloramphenicol-sensitive protein RarD